MRAPGGIVILLLCGGLLLGCGKKAATPGPETGDDPPRQFPRSYPTSMIPPDFPAIVA